MNLKIFSCAVALCCAVSVATAQNADVNAERVSMDAQLLRSINGQAQLGSNAVWPQSVLTLTQQAQQNSGADAYGAYIADYYGPTLLNDSTITDPQFFTSDSRFRGFTLNDGVVRAQGDLSAMFRAGTYDSSSTTGGFLLGRASLRFMGSYSDNIGFFLDLSNGVRLSGDPAFIAQTDPVLARTRKFVTEDSSFFDRYVGYVQYQSEHIRVRFGREALQFGFSPIDNMVHSINAPMMDGLLIDVPYKSFRFSMTHSAANGVDVDGNAYTSKYVATHRLAIDPTDWLSVSVSDMIVYWGRGLDFAYLNPLAFFVSAGLGTQERSENDNSLLSFDAAVRPYDGLMVYGTFLIDDLNYATLSDTSYLGNQNKFAYQLGASHVLELLGTAAEGKASLVSLEYVRVDPFTFTHRLNGASYSNFGSPIGYDIQPNSDRFALQWRTWFSARTYIRIDVDYTRHGENILDSAGNIAVGEHPQFPGVEAPIGNVGGDILRGDGDNLFGNAFLRGNVSTQRRLQLWFSSEPLTNIFTDVRVGYTNRSGGNAPGTFFFGSLECRIGF